MDNIKFKATYSTAAKEKGTLIWTVTYYDYSIETHIHDFYELNIVLSGTGIHRIEECAVPVKTGDVFVIPPYVAHSYNNCNNLDVFHLLIHPEFIRNNIGEARTVEGFTLLTEAEPFLRQNSPTPVFLRLSPVELEKTEHEIELISAKVGTYPEPLVTHAVWTMLYNFSYMLSHQVMTQKSTLSKSGEKEILQALEYIHLHYGEKITIQTLCDTVYMSRSTFLRRFSELCRCTPTEYIIKYREKQANEMLAKGALSRSEIAHMCGFYDLSHMDKVLKKM